MFQSTNREGERREVRSAAEPLLVDRTEASRLLGVSPGTLDNLRRDGAMPSIRIKARRLFAVEDIRRFIDSRKRA